MIPHSSGGVGAERFPMAVNLSFDNNSMRYRGIEFSARLAGLRRFGHPVNAVSVEIEPCDSWRAWCFDVFFGFVVSVFQVFPSPNPSTDLSSVDTSRYFSLGQKNTRMRVSNFASDRATLLALRLEPSQSGKPIKLCFGH